MFSSGAFSVAQRQAPKPRKSGTETRMADESRAPHTAFSELIIDKSTHLIDW